MSNESNYGGRTMSNERNSTLSTTREEKQAGGLASSIGERVGQMADTIREKAPASGRIGQVAGSVADGLKSGGEYLSHKGVNEMTQDLGEVVRKYPMYSLLAGVGFGLLLGAAYSKASS